MSCVSQGAEGAALVAPGGGSADVARGRVDDGHAQPGEHVAQGRGEGAGHW